MSAFHSILARSLPLVPKPIVRRVSRRYIAGESLATAIDAVRALNAEGLMATLDVLGESVTDRPLVDAAARDYAEALKAIRTERLDSNVSIKPTQFGLKIDFDLCFEKVRALVVQAAGSGNFVRIDMEDSSCTSATLDLYRRLRAEGLENVGVVLQACMRRSLADLKALPQGANVRLCKGIYVEPHDVAYRDRVIVNKNYTRLLEEILDRGIYAGIATHDEELVWEANRLIDRRALPASAYEFQMLLGVSEPLRRLIRRDGHRLRVYVPYGPHWYAYSLRRLKENPRIAGYILTSLMRRVGG
ncbi:MAG TPA: proline dehydrogenase family protein [Patescibacteria group bacterium]|nr:proline dehydrogenase family protein [Patescibacteria group bacterium]